MDGSLFDVAAVRAGAAFATLFALAAVFVATRVDVGTGFLAYLALCGLFALALPPRLAFLVSLSGWGFLTGFVVNRGGQLTFAVPDLAHLTVLVTVGTAVSVLRPRRPHRSRV
jgi:hypothetical protein